VVVVVVVVVVEVGVVVEVEVEVGVVVGVEVVSASSFEHPPTRKAITTSAHLIPGTIATPWEAVLWVAPSKLCAPSSKSSRPSATESGAMVQTSHGSWTD
jgi:hypothetical protein